MAASEVAGGGEVAFGMDAIEVVGGGKIETLMAGLSAVVPHDGLGSALLNKYVRWI